ncbi:MAG: hypothetical protein ACD_59C00069G0002 [uncultured bacterium]|nr:MAG: hypothetical protein ACD_59C00069G0002 [uncultured bacterium]HBC75535.1 hypothetical protein [Candidatus Wallbacteria bacterium]
MKKPVSLFILTLIAAALSFFPPSLPASTAADNNYHRLTVGEESGKYGFLDLAGKVEIEPQFKLSTDFLKSLESPN